MPDPYALHTDPAPTQPVAARGNPVRALLWTLLVLSVAANTITSFGVVSLAVSIALGVVTAATGITLISCTCAADEHRPRADGHQHRRRGPAPRHQDPRERRPRPGRRHPRRPARLRAMLTVDAPVREPLVRQAEELLKAVGIADPPQHASDLVGLVDALLMYRTAKAAPVDAASVVGAYLDGLPRPTSAA